MRFLVGYATRAFPAQIDCSSTVVKVVSRDETVNVPIAGLSNLVNVASLPLPEVALASTSKKASEYALYLRSVNDPFPPPHRVFFQEHHQYTPTYVPKNTTSPPSL